MALDVGVFSNLRPVQAPDLLGPYSTMMNLQTMKLQQQDIQQQTAERQQIARQRQLENQEVSDIGGYVQTQIQKGGKLDDEDFLNGLMRYPRFGAKMRAELEGIKKTRAETTAAEVATKKTQQEIDIGPTVDVAPGTTVFNKLKGQPAYTAPPSALQVAQTDEASARAREARADAALKELQTGNFPQTLDAALAQAGAIAPNDKTFSELNARYTGMLKNGPQNPAAWAATLKQLGEEAKSVSTAKATVPFKVEVQQAGAASATGTGLDLMAEQALNGNFTSRNPALMSKVYQRAADMAKERGMTSTGVIMAQNAAKANKEALNTLTRQQATVEAFSQTAEKNMKVLESAIAQVADLGSPFLNTPVRNIQAKFGGNPKVAAFQAAISPVQAEVAKILNSAGATQGMLTDTARGEMQAAISPGATPAQIKAALDIFRQDMANRRSTYQASIQDLTQKSAVGAPDNSGKPPAFTLPNGTVVRLQPDGTYR